MCPSLRSLPSMFLALLVAVPGIHFGMNFIYLLPLNPVVLRVAPLVDSYMNPWFAQDWRLFAPNPITETRILLVRCRVRQPDGRLIETAPADVSTPLWAAQARQRFSPAASLSRLQAHLSQLYLYQDDTLRQLTDQRASGDVATRELADALQEAQRPRHALATHLLARLGAAYCDQWYGAGQTVASQVSLTILRFPRFSQRQLPDTAGDRSTYSFDWMPYAPVAPLPAAPPAPRG